MHLTLLLIFQMIIINSFVLSYYKFNVFLQAFLFLSNESKTFFSFQTSLLSFKQAFNKIIIILKNGKLPWMVLDSMLDPYSLLSSVAFRLVLIFLVHSIFTIYSVLSSSEGYMWIAIKANSTSDHMCRVCTKSTTNTTQIIIIIK